MNGQPLPTIGELESILRGDHGPQDIEILPDGSIHAVPQGTAKDAKHTEPITLRYAKAEFFYIALLGALSALLCSCGPFIDVKHGIVSSGFLSSTQGFSGAMKNKDGSVTWSVVSTESENVANNAFLYGGVVSAGNNTLKTVQNNNATATTQQAQQQASALALQQSQQAASAAAAKVTQQNTARAAGVPALVKP